MDYPARLNDAMAASGLPVVIILIMLGIVILAQSRHPERKAEK